MVKLTFVRDSEEWEQLGPGTMSGRITAIEGVNADEGLYKVWERSKKMKFSLKDIWSKTRSAGKQIYVSNQFISDLMQIIDYQTTLKRNGKLGIRFTSDCYHVRIYFCCFHAHFSVFSTIQRYNNVLHIYNKSFSKSLTKRYILQIFNKLDLRHILCISSKPFSNIP